MKSKIIRLKRGKEELLSRKHPWIFSGACQQPDKSIEDGDVVEVWTHGDLFLGTGHYQGGGSIAIRMISFERLTDMQHFWDNRIWEAIQYRAVLKLPSSHTQAYRLIHGEGDGLPGLVLDIYGTVGVIQCHSIGIHRSVPFIKEALLKYLPHTDTLYVRCKDTLPEIYAGGVQDEFILGHTEDIKISENGIPFHIPIVEGQKTGFFLDQRDNRQLVGTYSKGKSVLNCFCYTGGFSLYALVNGATHVDSVDISARAIEGVDKNVGLINFNGTHQSHTANVMHYLASDDVQKYDIVIVDPPAFAKSLHKRHNAVQAYKRLNALALKKVKSGGLLFTFSCSQVVGTQLFHDTIVAAGLESGKRIRIMHQLSQGADHPVSLFHPEGHYLKGLCLYVEEESAQ
jgi:23S rRNA (cytosine1962-C5)-methyltransferase